MVKHIAQYHKEVNLEDAENREAEAYFKMELARQYRTEMNRQLYEALSIARAGSLDRSV